jgi:two-component system catabolic regulation response regulator CreB
MTDILIVEDDPAIAATVKFSLEREHYNVIWASTKADALTQIATMPTLSAVVLDVGLPDGDGFGVCQAIRSGTHHASVPIIFLTARDDEIDTIIALEMGADDYMTKPFSPRELVARLKAIWRRQTLNPQNPNTQTPSPDTPEPSDFCQLTAVGKWDYQHSTYTLSLDNTPLTLSKTELAVMLALLANPTHILSREQILTQVSDYPEHRLARTIDSHIKTLRQKLSAISTQDIIITHRGLGYSLC